MNAVKTEENDLTISRTMKNVTRDQIWKAWSDPEILAEWWCPKPWGVKDVLIELKPGGAFNTTMCGPNGEEIPGKGCIVYAREKECIVFTDCMTAGWRPSGESFMTAVIEIEDCDEGVRYCATVRHKNAEDSKKHDDMGFHDGWGKTLEQLEEIAGGL